MPGSWDSYRNVALSSRCSLRLARAKETALLKIMSSSRGGLHPVTDQCGHQGLASEATQNNTAGPHQLESSRACEETASQLDYASVAKLSYD